MKISPNSVIIDQGILRTVLEELLPAYPNEHGMFLLGEPAEGKTKVVRINGYYVPPSGKSTNKAWYFMMRDYHRALEYAGQTQRQLVGFIHTHPWSHPRISGTCLSQHDGKMLMEHGLLISGVLHNWPTGWWMAFWAPGNPAVLNLYVKTTTGEEITLERFMTSCRSRKSPKARYYNGQNVIK